MKTSAIAITHFFLSEAYYSTSWEASKTKPNEPAAKPTARSAHSLGNEP